MTIHRRHVLATATAAAALSALTNPIRAAAAKGTAVMTYEPKPQPIDPEAIKGFSAKLLTSHYDNNYTGAVKRLNAITAALRALDWASAPNFTVNGLKREELIAMNSMILHELYFANLGVGDAPSGPLAHAIERDFGSHAAWQAEFAAMGKALGGGSGWVLLCYVPRAARLVNSWAADHTMLPAGATPILALDMYEHAYHMDYGAKAGAYVDAYMKAIAWKSVARHFEAAAR